MGAVGVVAPRAVGRGVDEPAAHPVRELEGAGGAGEVAAVGEDVRGRGDVLRRLEAGGPGVEVLRRGAVHGAPECHGRRVHPARHELGAGPLQREAGVLLRGGLEPVHLGERPREVAPEHERIEQRRVGPERGGLDGHPVPAQHGGGGAGPGERLGRRPPAGCRREGIRGHEHHARRPTGGLREHLGHVLVGEGVVGHERHRAREGAVAGGEPLRRRGRGVVEPGVAEAVPGVGVGRVALQQLVVEAPRRRVVRLQEGAVGIDHQPLVQRQGAGVHRRADHRLLRHGVLGAEQPAPGQSQPVPGEAEGRVDRHRATELPVGRLEVPSLQVIHPREVGPVGLERRAGGGDEAGLDAGRRPRDVEQRARQPVEERPLVAARQAGHLGHVHPAAAGDVEHPCHEGERVAHPLVLAQDDGPGAGVPREAAGHVEADRLVGVEVAAVEQVVDPAVVHHGQVVPLGQVEPEHRDAAVAQPLGGGVVAQVVERQHEDRAPGVHRLGRAARAARERDRGADRQRRGRDAERQRQRRDQPAVVLVVGAEDDGSAQQPHDEGGERQHRRRAVARAQSRSS